MVQILRANEFHQSYLQVFLLSMVYPGRKRLEDTPTLLGNRSLGATLGVAQKTHGPRYVGSLAKEKSALYGNRSIVMRWVGCIAVHPRRYAEPSKDSGQNAVS